MKKIGYANFIRIFRIDDPRDRFPGLLVKPDGVWVDLARDEDMLTYEERAILSEHPDDDFSRPALGFPCYFEQVENFLNFYGMSYEVSIAKERWKKLCSKDPNGISNPANSGTTQSPSKPPLIHSDDFRSIKKGDKEHLLSEKQGKVIKILLENYMNNTPAVGQKFILKEINPETTTTSDLQDVFKSNMDAWKALIESPRKGLYRLKK